MQGQKRVYFYAVSAVVIWSTTAALVKSLLSTIPTYEALFLSSFAASLFLVGIQLVRDGGRVFRTYDIRNYAAMVGLGFLGLFLYSGLYYYGLTQLTSQEACILNFLWPMMIVLFAALLLGERITVRTAAALLLSFSGVVVLTLGGEGAWGHGPDIATDPSQYAHNNPTTSISRPMTPSSTGAKRYEYYHTDGTWSRGAQSRRHLPLDNSPYKQ